MPVNSLPDVLSVWTAAFRQSAAAGGSRCYAVAGLLCPVGPGPAPGTAQLCPPRTPAGRPALLTYTATLTETDQPGFVGRPARFLPLRNTFGGPYLVLEERQRWLVCRLRRLSSVPYLGWRSWLYGR